MFLFARQNEVAIKFTNLDQYIFFGRKLFSIQ